MLNNKINGIIIVSVFSLFFLFSFVLALKDYGIITIDEGINDTVLNKTKLNKTILLSCTDSDEKDFFNLGFINLTKGNKSKLFYDECVDETNLIEYLCKVDNKKEINYECEYGCFEGKCLTCEDLDNCNTGNETNETIVNSCEDNTLINECNSGGYRCIGNFELVFDKTCIKLSPQEMLTSNIGIINYFYSKDMLIAKEYNG